jgi:hypothetical protein
MSRFLRALALGTLLTCGVLESTPARAHINLLEPVARVPGFPDSTLSSGPCGQRQNERLEDRVNVLRPGQSIDMVWEVYVRHASYFRVSFDADGDDSFSTRASAPSNASTDDPTELPAGDGEIILDYVMDRGGNVDRVERRVTLPEVECDRCTLQLTQFTYGLPLDDAIYYQCADLVLDDGDGVVEDDFDTSAGGAGGESSGCSLAAGAAARGEARRWGWLAPLAASLALGSLRSRRRARREKAQGAGRDSIHSRSSST